MKRSFVFFVGLLFLLGFISEAWAPTGIPVPRFRSKDGWIYPIKSGLGLAINGTGTSAPAWIDSTGNASFNNLSATSISPAPPAGAHGLVAGQSDVIAAPGLTSGTQYGLLYSSDSNYYLTTVSATGTTYNAGNGLDLAGTTFSADNAVLHFDSEASAHAASTSAHHTQGTGGDGFTIAGVNLTGTGDTVDVDDAPSFAGSVTTPALVNPLDSTDIISWFNSNGLDIYEEDSNDATRYGYLTIISDSAQATADFYSWDGSSKAGIDLNGTLGTLTLNATNTVSSNAPIDMNEYDILDVNLVRNAISSTHENILSLVRAEYNAEDGIGLYAYVDTPLGNYVYPAFLEVFVGSGGSGEFSFRAFGNVDQGGSETAVYTSNNATEGVLVLQAGGSSGLAEIRLKSVDEEIQLGADLITVYGDVLPQIASTYDLGSISFPMRAVYANSIIPSEIVFDVEDMPNSATTNQWVLATDGAGDSYWKEDATGGGTTYSAGLGLALVGTEFSFDGTLDEVNDPANDASFTFGNNSILFKFDGPTSNGFEIDITGAFTGDGLHIHQHDGNPTPEHLVHIEAEDPDINPLVVISEGTLPAAIFSGDITANIAVLEDLTLSSLSPKIIIEELIGSDDDFIIQTTPTSELTITNMSAGGGTVKATWSFQADGDFEIRDGNLVLTEALATIDGVDVSVHAASSSAHHTQVGNLLLNSVVIAGASLTIDTYRLEKEQVAITLTDIHCITDTGTVIIELMEQDSAGANDTTVDAPITCDSNGAEDDGSLTNGTIDAADWLAARIGTEASSPTQVNITWYYTVD